MYALGLLALINLLSYVNRSVVFALFEAIKHDLGVTDAQLGWVASAYVLVFSLAALPFGVLGDLRSRRAVIGVMPLGALWIGLVAQHAGEPVAIVVAAVLSLIVAACVWLFAPKVRALE
jgi:MFS family permease